MLIHLLLIVVGLAALLCAGELLVHGAVALAKLLNIPSLLVGLTVVAFGTSVFSAIVGMGGGIVLLSVMLLFLYPLVAVPLHGAIQLVSNGSRAVAQRRYLAWPLIWRYSTLLLPVGALAIGLVTSVPENAIPPEAK